MTLRRLLLFAGIALILFLGMYSWNRRTRVLDDLAANLGLEISGAVLRPLRASEDFIGDFWSRYVNLVDVRGENERLKARVAELEARLLGAGEDLAELRRLRELVQFPVDVRWHPIAARVLAGRLGPNGVLDSITISRGYATGARPGTPLVTHLGLVGRILRASAHASTALLITDPGSNIAVFGQESRAAGILKGCGMGRPMEVDFVQRDAGMKTGELLVTSGLDNKYPKGLPVGRVVSISPSDYTQFMAVEVAPLVDLGHIEEVLLLEKSGVELPPEEPDGPQHELVGPPLPPSLAKKAGQTPENKAPQASAPQTPRKMALTPPTDNAVTPEPTPPKTPAAQARPVAPAPVRQTVPENIPRTADGAPRYRIITP